MEPRRRKKRERGDECVGLESHATLAQDSSISEGQYSDASDPSTASPWTKSVLVRVKPSMDQTMQDLRYTFVRLPSLDVASCVATICTKLGISFTRGMPVTWVDSKTLLRGPLNCTFLQDMPDMQDFVVTLIDVGNNGDVGLLLEM